MANKVRYGLRNVKRARVNRADDGTVTFGDFISVPGAQTMTATPEGSDAKKVYADDGAYFVVDATNGGYSIDMQFVHLSDAERADILGEMYDETTGVQYESTEDRAPEYAWVMEMQGDFKPIAFCFYCGKAKRPNINANTKGESVDVDTDTLTIDFVGLPLPFQGEVKNVIQGHIEKTEENATKFEAFFDHVVVPTPEASAPSTNSSDPSGE